MIRRGARYWARYVTGVMLGVALGWIVHQTTESRVWQRIIETLVVGAIVTWIAGDVRRRAGGGTPSREGRSLERK